MSDYTRFRRRSYAKPVGSPSGSELGEGEHILGRWYVTFFRLAGQPAESLGTRSTYAPAIGANVTEDKNFKHLVRDEARRSGRPYTEVRADLRPPAEQPPPARPMDPTEVAERFEAIVSAIDSVLLGKHEMVRLLTTALLVPGNVLLTDVAGNGMTILGRGVAAAINGRLVAIDGRTGFHPAEVADWRADDVILVSHLDGLEPSAQVAIIEAGDTPAIVIAKRHPIPSRMPHPPDDDTRERFLLGLQLGYADSETEMEIVAERETIAARRAVSSGSTLSAPSAAIDAIGLAAMRSAAATVKTPDDVRRFAVDAIAATRDDPALALGGSTVTTVALVRSAAAAAIADGRNEATIADARRVLLPVLAHRVVFKPGVEADLGSVIERTVHSALEGAVR